MARLPKLKTMSDRIRYLRILAGMTQYTLAERADVSRGAVLGWECRGFNVTDKNLAKIAAVFGVAPEWIRDGKGKTPTEVKREA